MFKINTTSGIERGGDIMKKGIILTIVALFALGAAAVATPVSTTIYSNPAGFYNVVAPPVVPFNPAPADVFKKSGGAPIDLSGGKLYRWDAATQGMILYDPDTPEDFGGILLGDGYCLLAVESDNFIWQYDGAPDGLPDSGNNMTDMWISLPLAGATLFGHPFNHSVPLANCFVTDGTQTVSFAQAAAAGWVDAWVWGWDAEGQGFIMVTPDDPDYPDLVPFHGYQIQSYVDNLALIIPAQ